MSERSPLGLSCDCAADSARALRESEERYRLLVESLPHGVGLVQEGRVVFANAAALAMLGHGSIDELAAVEAASLFEAAERSRVLPLLASVEQEPEPRPRHLLSRALRRTGEAFPVELHVTAVTYRAARAYQIFVMDITERVRVEQDKRMLDAQLREALRFESVGRLASGIAHDFNNVLQPILMHADVALLELHEGDPYASDFRKIRDAALRAKELVRQLNAFGRQHVARVEALDLDTLVLGTVAVLRRLVREDVELRTELGEDVPKVLADPDQLQQVIIRLTLDARDNLEPGGVITLRTASVPADAPRDVPGLGPGRYALLAISEGGPQRAATNVRERIYDPVIGLPGAPQHADGGATTVHGVVAQHGGTIVAAEDGAARRAVQIFLPEAAERVVEALATGPGVAASEELRADRTILVTEDDAVSRSQLCGVLRRHGFTVLEAADGEQALGVAERHAGPIHVLLADVIMPRMSGDDLHRRLRTRRAELSVIFMSGHPDDIVASSGVRADEVLFLRKPFSLGDLLEKLRRALGA